jgi:hypothetical protein
VLRSVCRGLFPVGLVAAIALAACQGGNVGPHANESAPVSIAFRGAQPVTVVRDVDGIRRSLTFKTKIQHVVVISMENRTVDNLFAGMYSQPFPGGGTWGSALNLRNPAVSPTLQPNSFSAHFDPSHLHDVGWKFESRGEWNEERIACAVRPCPKYATALSYVPANDNGAKIYQSLVENWAIAVNMLQANEGPSFPAHQYFIAAQSGGVPGSASAPDAEAENPVAVSDAGRDPDDEDDGVTEIATGGCNSPTYNIATVDMSKPVPTGSPFDNGTALQPPCDEYQTILDEIASAQGKPDVADWQYIAHSNTTIWAAPMGVAHLYKQYLDTDAKHEPFAVDQDAVNFVRNLTDSTNPAPDPKRPFASLTYITPCEHEADHPHVSGIDNGPRWLGWLINSIGESKYWKSTAIIITWDDWGGWYDHVPGMPNPGPYRPKMNPYDNPDDPNEWGFRIPLLVISPYVHKAFVSSQATSGFKYRSQSVIAQFVEANFGLPSLGADDMQGGQQDALKDIFDFTQKPRPYVPVDVNFHPPALGHCV